MDIVLTELKEASEELRQSILASFIKLFHELN